MVQQRYPSSELLAAGWSLGANILVRYVGEEGDQCPISAAASLCNPLDLVSTPCTACTDSKCFGQAATWARLVQAVAMSDNGSPVA